MDEKHDGVWALVISEGKRFLGNISKYLVDYTHDGVSIETWKEVDHTKSPGDIQQDILRSRLICLKPVLDFISIDQPRGEPDAAGNVKISFSKNPVTLPYDYALKGGVVYTKWSTIMFIEDLEKEDQEFYMELVDDGMKKTGKKDEKPLIAIPPPGTVIPTRPHSRGNGGR